MTQEKPRYNKGDGPGLGTPPHTDSPHGPQNAGLTTETWLCIGCGRHRAELPAGVCSHCQQTPGRVTVTVTGSLETTEPTPDPETPPHPDPYNLLRAPDHPVRDPRAWCSHVVDSCATLGAMADALRAALESEATDLEPDGEHATLWTSVSELVAADLAVACYVLARVTARLALAAPKAECTECGESAAHTCRRCGEPLCGEHRVYTGGMLEDVTGAGLCPGCADEYRIARALADGGH